mmetsp:Transcript_8323/g.12328  ORF Transcript_8323/g.12328 Transcript_8323/m.12328 type:complete len:373 (-) Transcript_8323:1213-2331(-)|eukprot:CAMPEP_0196813312 /NCGR_PEP_ID=MMETSP1362-20130617/35594_1 /TAXON_ID=163516 /ORGANISM="Leptocylindrus danicus, Strain CCMP1856" /LENGTH=372 /DNA_ID=CAMNT_0042189459 /DNA_START=73 /DNA_END=1191 /DNA_ORIENTATION=-
MHTTNPGDKETTRDWSQITATSPTVATATVGGQQNVNSQLLSGKVRISVPTTTRENAAAEIPESANQVLLGEKLVGDVLVACGITLGVAPFMTVVDKAIVQRAAGTHSVLSSAGQSLQGMLRNPVAYVKSPMFLMMWGVYAATYTTANCIKTVCEHESSSVSKDHAKASLFVGTTAVNSGTTLLKDRAYATMFGTSGAAVKVPMVTYGLWGLRDCMVIGSSFVLPDLVGSALHERTNMEKAQADRIAQFFCPVATQFLAGPVQLLGLDFYNRPLHDLSTYEATLERLRLLKTNFMSIVGARIARIAPAYGIGGIGNTYFRDSWRAMILSRAIRNAMIEKETSDKARRLVPLVVAQDEVERELRERDQSLPIR